MGRRQVPEHGPVRHVGGQTAVGAEAASRLYFNKPAKDLTLRQAAMLAGMPQAPSQYSPVDNRVGTIQRRNEVLGKMAELGYITRGKAPAEMKKGLGLNMKKYFQRARERYVLDYVKSELIKDTASTTCAAAASGLHDDRPQEAEGSARGDRGAHGQRRPVVRDRDDQPAQRRHPRHGVLQEYGKSKYNLAAQGKRQPGSAFKTMVLMTALRLGVNPNSTTYSSRGT